MCFESRHHIIHNSWPSQQNLSDEKHVRSCWCHFMVISTNAPVAMWARGKVKQPWRPESRKPPAWSLLSRVNPTAA